MICRISNQLLQKPPAKFYIEVRNHEEVMLGFFAYDKNITYRQQEKLANEKYLGG